MLRSSRMLASRTRRVVAGTAATGAALLGGSVAYAAFVDTDNVSVLGARRQSLFWGRVFPIVFDYYWHFSRTSPYVKYQKWSLKRNYSKTESNDKNKDTTTEEDAEEALLKIYKDRRKVVMDELHQRHAPEILQAMLDLKGLYIKLGQVLSVTALPIPEPYRVLFRTLQSDVPGWEDFETVVKPILEKEFGVSDVNEIFSVIHPVPCGAASIGQAHQAKLRNNNSKTGQHEDVIIKVQYPNAAWQVPADIQCVGDFLKICVWAGVVDESASRLSFDEFSRQFLAELDYGAEKDNLQEVYESSIVHNSPYQKRGVVVPSVYEEFCTPRVITMTYLPGPKLEQEARRQLEMLGIDMKKGVGSLVRDAAKEASSDRIDATVALTEEDGKVAVPANTALATQNSWKASIGKTIGSMIGVDAALWAVRVARKIMLRSTAFVVTAIQSSTYIAPAVIPQSWDDWAESHRSAAQQGKRLALTESWIDALFDVHGHQIFQLGLFNADPHPGNILVLEEDGDDKKSRADPKLGLIDFGQCKRLTPQERVGVAELILSVAEGKSDEEVAASFRKLGVKTKNDSTEFLADFAYLMFGPLKPQHLDHGWHKKLHELDSIDYFPKELSMVYRTSLLLRGLALSLQVNASIGEHWQQHAQDAIDEHGTAVIGQQELPPATKKEARSMLKQTISGKSMLASA